MDQAQIGDIIRMLRRRFWLLFPILLMGTIATVFVAMRMPSVYEASAKVLVESQQIPDELARSTVNLTTEARLELIKQRLMSRDRATALIEKLGLYRNAPGLSAAAKVDALRKSVTIQNISANSNPWDTSGGALVAFTITASMGDAAQAAALANELAESAIAQNLQVGADRARETLAYFQTEEKRAAAALSAAEAELTRFKEQHAGELPEDLAPSRDALDRLETANADIDTQLLDLDLRRAELRATLAGTPISGLAAGPTAREAELERLEIALATRRKVLGASHPELRKLQTQIDAVRALIDEAPATGPDESSLPAPRAAVVREQIDQLTLQIEQLQARKTALAEQRVKLEAAARRNPAVEAALSGLERQLTQLQERYTDVARRHSEARTGAQLEANQQSERFEILERAQVPAMPVGPNRNKLLVLGVGASGAAALGLAVLLELLRPTMRTSAQMERQLKLRPVVSIPYVARPGEARRRRMVLAGCLVALAAGLWLAAPLIDRYVFPLEPLRKLVERPFADTAEVAGAPSPY